MKLINITSTALSLAAIVGTMAMATPAKADNGDVIKGIFGVIVLNELLNNRPQNNTVVIHEYSQPRRERRRVQCGTYTEVELTRYGRIYYTYDACTHQLIDTELQ